jgi:hypothetical protein
MAGVKIKIECEDYLLAAAIASSIGRGLEADKFTNVGVKCLMMYRETVEEVPGAPMENISKHINNPDPAIMGSKPMYFADIVPVQYIESKEQRILDLVREHRPTVLDTPVLIDMNHEPPPYENLEKAFLRGKKS